MRQQGVCPTDLAGRALDFSTGRELAKNRGIIATNGRVHEAVLEAVKNWDCSRLLMPFGQFGLGVSAAYGYARRIGFIQQGYVALRKPSPQSTEILF